MDLITLATVPAIVALVNVLKRLGVPDAAATIAAVLLGVAAAVADQLVGTDPTYQAAAHGLLLGLAAAGVYDLANTRPADTPRRAVQ